MRRSIVEPWRLCGQGPSTHDAHRWPRSDDRRPLRLTGQAKYGNNCVQEIVSGTISLNVTFSVLNSGVEKALVTPA